MCVCLTFERLSVAVCLPVHHNEDPERIHHQDSKTPRLQESPEKARVKPEEGKNKSVHFPCSSVLLCSCLLPLHFAFFFFVSWCLCVFVLFLFCFLLCLRLCFLLLARPSVPVVFKIKNGGRGPPYNAVFLLLNCLLSSLCLRVCLLFSASPHCPGNKEAERTPVILTP